MRAVPFVAQAGYDWHMARPPQAMRWLFWDVDVRELDTRSDADYLLGRVLEFGRLADAQWLIRTFGKRRIHRYLRESGDPELSPRTIAFWRAVFKAWRETWASPPLWRRSIGAPWGN